MRPSWFKISAILAGVWLVLGTIVWWLEERRPSPEKLVAFAMTHRVSSRPEAEHASMISAVAAEYQKLDMADRSRLLTEGEFTPWWQELSKPERYEFRTQLFPQTQQLADFFDTFTPEQKAQNLQRLMQDVRKRGGEGFAVPEIPPMIAGMVKTVGLKVFLQSPMIDEKFEYLLVFYEMEKRLVWRRR